MPNELTQSPEDQQFQAYIETLRAKGVPEEYIKQILEQGPNKDAITDQYKMSSILRKGAIDPDAGNVFGAIGKGLMGYQAGKEQREYQASMKELGEHQRKKRATAMDAWRLGREEEEKPTSYGGGPAPYDDEDD